LQLSLGIYDQVITKKSGVLEVDFGFCFSLTLKGLKAGGGRGWNGDGRM